MARNGNGNGIGMRMPMRPTPGWHSVNGQARHWSMRGYPSSMNAAKGYYGGTTLNEQWRHELAGDAQKLRAKQMAERQRLDDDKQSLQNDLDSHLTPILTPKSISKQTETALIPNGTATEFGPRSMSSAPSSSNGHKLKHHALFDSLKAPLTTTPKKQKNRTPVSAKGTPSKLKPMATLSADSNAKKEDSDSTLSTATSTATAAPTEWKEKKSRSNQGHGGSGSVPFHFDFVGTQRVLENILSAKQSTNTQPPPTFNKRLRQNGTSTHSPSSKRIKLNSE